MVDDVDGRLNVNVALNRPSYQVNEYIAQYLPASLANDGSKSDLFYGSCAHTDLAVNPWWAVDLLVKLFVAGVKFTNRGDDMSR